MTEKQTPCETLKAIIDSQTIEVSAISMINMKDTLTRIIELLGNVQPKRFSMNKTIRYDDYRSICYDMERLMEWVDNNLKAVELPAHYKPIVKELIEQAQK